MVVLQHRLSLLIQAEIMGSVCAKTLERVEKSSILKGAVFICILKALHVLGWQSQSGFIYMQHRIAVNCSHNSIFLVPLLLTGGFE